MTDTTDAKDEQKGTRREGKIVVDDAWVSLQPIDTPELFEAHKLKLQTLYGAHFSDQSEFDLFCMLPVRDEQRTTIIRNMTAAHALAGTAVTHETQQ